MDRYRISFAGAGRVASSLSTELLAKGHKIQQVISPGRGKGKKLAGITDAVWSDILEYKPDTDLIIVAVPDNQLHAVLSNIQCGSETIVVHTAGSYGTEVFPSSINRCGVFYPLQTFSEGRKVEFSNIPVFIETVDAKALHILRNIGESLGCRVFDSDIMHRRLIHVAAVFVSNFTNYMLISGERLATRSGYPADLLRPLIIETVNKALENGPVNSQTGPAVRYDYKTIEKHLDLLSFSPELQTVYEEISRSIMNYYKQKGKDDQL